MTDQRQSIIKVQRVDEMQRLVFGEVYAPNRLDSYGEFMLAEDIQLMAHRFMRLDLSQVIDADHDEVAKDGCYPVESFIARDGDPDYTPGAWVVGVKIEDDEMWDRVLDGTINGFSFQCMVQAVAVEVEIEVVRDHVGVVQRSETAPDHDHMLFVQVNEAGRVIGGWTSTDNGHRHRIKHGSVTEEADGHTHRFDL